MVHGHHHSEDRQDENVKLGLCAKFIWCLNSAENWGPGSDFSLESD